MSATDPHAFAVVRDAAGPDGHVVVNVAGELDVATAERFGRELRATLVSAPVILDLSGLIFMDSSGVRALDALLREGAAEGWSLQVRRDALQPGVEQVLRLTGMLDVLPEAGRGGSA